jgi:hypothetical protein
MSYEEEDTCTLQAKRGRERLRDKADNKGGPISKVSAPVYSL